MKLSQSELLKAWLKTRPKSVQTLAKEFPFMSSVGTNVVIGWTEDDKLIVADQSYVGYDALFEHRTYVCAKHHRGHK